MKIGKQFTNRESQSIDKYLQEIGKVELLDVEEEIDLAKRSNTATIKRSRRPLKN